MCGIAGVISINPNKVSYGLLKGMTDAIAHRGPDGDGHWISENGCIGLGHRRLSIIDLSHDADQPMHYLNRYTIAFNGEIYNYIELRETLLQQGYTFKTQSDTEVLLALYDRDKEKCLPLLDGMFAFVLYDKEDKTIFCARDRFGEKPFFYSYEKGKHFYFGSEMKCLWAAGVSGEVSNKMLFNYLAYGFVENENDSSETFYTKCTRLPHAHYLKMNPETLEISIHRYYDIQWQETISSTNEGEIAEHFLDLFTTSVKRRLRSDVTVGSSLSGGLDSSLVVCIIDTLKAGTNQKQNTFSAVFPGFKKDERKYMDYVLAKTNVHPFFVTPTEDDLANDLNNLFYHQEEPFGSASIYVQYRVMQLAKEHGVTVLLDGQGADEMLAGYHGYYTQFFNELKGSNISLYKKEKEAFNALHANSDINPNLHTNWKNIVKQEIGKLFPSARVHYEKIKQVKKPFFHPDFFETYFKESIVSSQYFASLNQSLYHSTLQRGLHELLRYADRNSMAHSREVRLPFLNHELVDFVFSLPSTYKIKDGWTKWIMREAAKDILPKEICWRKDKIGFEPPQKSWMENKQMQESILSHRQLLVSEGILHKKVLLQPIISEQANISKNNTWRMWMGGNLIKGK
jgi:asparagine synthase (glutamine-hydrolysing)